MDELRIGDAEREASVAALGEHFAQGRLTREEYDERSDAVWSARTRGDLVPVFADLPPEARVAVPAAAGSSTLARRPDWLPPWFSRGLLGPLVALLVVLTVLTHLPFVLVGLAVWFLLSRRHGVGRPPWAGHGHRARGW